jgi:hypothetical protein
MKWWLKNIFWSNSKSENMSKEISDKREVLIGLSSVSIGKIPANAEVVAESYIPAYGSIGNLIFEKKYHEAIELGNILLESTPLSAGVHVNLMEAYFKLRNENPLYMDKMIEHARLAMLYGHNTGLVQKRLAISLEKKGKIFQAIQLCTIVLLDKFHFSRHGHGNKDEFQRRREKLANKTSRTLDKFDDTLFTNDDINYLLEQIRLDDVSELKQMAENEEKINQLKRGNDDVVGN